MRQRLFTITFLVALIFGGTLFSMPLSIFSNGIAHATEASNEKAKDVSESDPWSVRCSELKNPETDKVEKHCEIVQRIVETETRKLFSEIAIGYPADTNAARGVIVLPLGTLLEPGVKMQIDKGQIYSFSFRYCVAAKIEGCVAVVKLPESILNEMKRGGEAKISFVNVRGQTINLPITLTGFTKAIDTLNKT